MDTFKEIFVSLSNDRWLTRDVAVLAVDGPGQAESLVLGYKVSVPNFIEAGKVIVDWAQQRPEIDPHRIGLFGNSFGSFTSTLIASNEPRLRHALFQRPALSQDSIHFWRPLRRPTRSA